MTPEIWAPVHRALSRPCCKGLMGSYAEQSRSMVTQMRKMQKQTEQMLGVLGLKR